MMVADATSEMVRNRLVGWTSIRALWALPLPSVSVPSSSRCRRSNWRKNIGVDVRDVCGARVRQPLLERRPRGGVAAYVA